MGLTGSKKKKQQQQQKQKQSQQTSSSATSIPPDVLPGLNRAPGSFASVKEMAMAQREAARRAAGLGEPEKMEEPVLMLLDVEEGERDLTLYVPQSEKIQARALERVGEPIDPVFYLEDGVKTFDADR
mmetsp:Transcript_5092/g.9121  ORF Transcript_5092/g.9121 Transcript_5092/m.9121 type:complete len:128 (-) Transcript_5092:283-666(-)|eukprot:CAMPEP_0184520606 /NCGR_PEP_ID=MMETSP0198_2-20121128/7261_1 /TAXON_ID=1112570 /ORGANISM="Thraustochytrium sp., Strain LLF1b" /LENGTH=127 /DNA_ID=CAMNT_0026911223 /DNA_START=107 /DNA_END=490 /DNA_ORIENTATION=-